MSSKTLVQIDKLSKMYRVKKGRKIYRLTAVDNVSIEIFEGETLGLVGESGCGKTTLGQMICGIQEQTDGAIFYKTKDLNKDTSKQSHTEKRLARAKKIQYIFQNPYSSMNPRMTISDILGEGIDIHNLAQNAKERTQLITQMMSAVELHHSVANRYPHEFSGGQRQRIAIARALLLEPELIICDEPTSALDVSIQAQIINLLISLQNLKNLSYLFISHDLATVAHISDRIAVMYFGQIVEIGPARDVFSKPLHPYTQALVSLMPKIEKNRHIFEAIQGEPPNPLNPPKGCPFAERCPMVQTRCRESSPLLRTIKEDHTAACHFV